MRPHLLSCFVFVTLLTASSRSGAGGGKPAPVASAAPSASAAVPAPVASDALTDQARELHTKGVELFQKGEFEKARAAFLAAWALKKHPQIASNLGAAENQVGKYKDAAEHFAWFLREAGARADPNEKKIVETLFAKAKLEIATIKLTVSEPGAEVRVDGALVGKSPLADPLFLEPGAHTIEARKDGFESSSQTVTASKGMNETRAITLTNKASGGGQNSIVPVIALGGAAVVVAGVSVGLFVASSDKGNAALQVSDEILGAGRSCVAGAGNYDSRCASIASEASTADTMNRAGIGTMIGAGALALGAGAYWMFVVREPKKQSAQVVPFASPQAGGVIVRGTF